MPDQITTILKMPLADAALAGVVGEISQFRAPVQCHHGIAATESDGTVWSVNFADNRVEKWQPD